MLFLGIEGYTLTRFNHQKQTLLTWFKGGLLKPVALRSLAFHIRLASMLS